MPRLPPIGADEGETDAAAEIDNIVPSFGCQNTPLLGIGGSAGALPALEEFLAAAPATAGLTYVVVMHLSPDHASALPEILQKHTQMPVQRAVSGERTEPNRVYVIPPGKQLLSVNGHLRLTDLEENGGRATVDLFFRSLADTHGPHAVGVVLSGADGDGTLGIKRIKERGGLTIAQDPGEAQHSAMPQSAIASGMIDWVLRVADMPPRIVEYIAREKRLSLRPEAGAQPAEAGKPPQATEPEVALREILVFLRMRTGRDFAYYKRPTILRRISRRMQVNGVDDLQQYLTFLRTHPGEAGALFKDLLISVTNFFRDREAFAALEAQIPALFAGKTHGDAVRVWVPACATGEEAYSIAMLLLKHARLHDAPPAVQVFGCDLEDDAIQVARAGLYPETICADVSEDRLRRFFVKEHDGYRIRREVREVVLFAAHDLLKDAPFSRLDLISCRNLLIYLNHEAQARAFEIFHFELKPDGILFLGASESIEDGSQLFRVIDKRHRLYGRKSAVRTGLPVPPGTSLLHRNLDVPARAAPGHATGSSPTPATPGSATASPARASRPLGREHDRGSWSEVHLKLIDRIAPPSVLVDREYDIQHATTGATRYLHFIGGEPTMNLLRLVDPSLRVELRTTLFRALQSGETAVAPGVPLMREGKVVPIDLRVSPAKEIAPDLLLVVFEERVASSGEPLAEAKLQSEPMVQHLERELEKVKAQLRDTVEQYEASTEELKASNEELQAMNEELRSATEELETSREELQSINEELTTVNQEMKNKVDELAHANSDLQNLMSATAIATLFLDREMRIMRFTASAAPIFNLIPGDIGRPLSHLQHRIDYPDMAADATRVLEKLVPVERQVTGLEGTYYLARMLPYRTVEDRIAGVVLTFVDITERQRAQQALAQHVDELTRFNQAAVGRETRMIELKQEVNTLLARLGDKPRYNLDALQE